MHLIASDIDGTFINSAERVTPRLLDALTHATKTADLVLATGRPPRWVHPIVEQLPIRPICVCANGAVLYDSDTGRILNINALNCEAITTIMELVDNVGYACERVGEREEFLVTADFIHLWDSDEHDTVEPAQIAAKPATKLLLRNDNETAWDMYQRIQPLIPPDLAHVTFSIGEGLLEISAPGVNKAAGVAAVAEFYGVSAADVVAFGDMPNDIEMLQWAGHGVAMGNADEQVKRAADEVTTSNNDFGVARVLERLFGNGAG